MKPGTRTLGVAESFRRGADRSTLAGVVARASRVVDGVEFSTTTVGGTDVTDAVVELFRRHDREDVQYVLVAGVALSWYNVLDLEAVRAKLDRPVLSVTFEGSEGLERPLREQFDGDSLERRLETYRSLPPRHRVDLHGSTAYVRAAGLEASEARDVLRAFTPEGGRPEPLRVARMAARAGDQLRSEQ